MPSWSSHLIADNTLMRWMGAALVALAVFATLRGLIGVATRRLAAVDAAQHSYAATVSQVLGSVRAVAVVAVAIACGLRSLSFDPAVHTWIGRGVVVVLAVQAGVSITLGIRLVIDGRRAADDVQPGERTMGAAAGFASNLVVWSLLALVVLSNFGVEVTTLVAGLGIGGVAAALAVQNVLGDLFAAFSLYLDRPFDLGDFVVVDTYMGTVEKISWRSTQLRSLGGEMVVLSNGDLARSRIRNYKRMKERRVVVELGIEYGTPAEKVERVPSIVHEAVDGIEGLRFDRAHLSKLGSASIDFESVFYVLSADYNEFMDRQQKLLLAIYRRFEQDEIAFAFPTQTLHLRGTPSPRPAIESKVAPSEARGD